VLSVLVLPTRGKSEGEARDEEHEKDDCHHDHQHRVKIERRERILGAFLAIGAQAARFLIILRSYTEAIC